MADTLLQQMISAMMQPALLVGLDQRVTACNAPAAAILGHGLTGRHFITALRQPQIIDAIEQCMRNGSASRARYHGSDGGSETTYDLRCARIEADEASGILITLEDLTDEEQVIALRRDFVANVSHELRTPLTAVMGFIETLQGPAKDDPVAQARFLQIMADETARMNRLVGDLMSLSRVEAEARRRPTEPIVIAALLASIVHSLGPMTDDAAASVLLDVAQDADDVTVPGDADQLRQVFSNLIENAVKYGGQGVQVTVHVAAPRSEPRLRTRGCRVTVRDTGPGFDPIHIPRLTERFYRVDSHRSREMGGTGLGLAIVKHIVNRHRGRLEIRSDVGQGAEFTVILPIS